MKCVEMICYSTYSVLRKCVASYLLLAGKLADVEV